MIRIAMAALAFTAFAPMTSSFAQDMDIHVDRGRDRDVRVERRVRMDGDMDHRHGCRTVIVRRHTPEGTVTRRTRTCG